MSAQIIKFPYSTIRICRLRNGVMEYKTIPGTWSDVPHGWSMVLRRVLNRGGFAA